jgi:putative membrane protein
MKKHFLTEKERQHLDIRVAEAEQRTGCQIVLAVIERSDSYPELPWKAFALGASAAGLVVFTADLLRPEWVTSTAVLFAVAAILVAGAAAALLTITLPRCARLFLDRNRADAEVLQYAESLFLKRELFATTGRNGILLLVSLFEREVVLLPDTGLEKRLSREAEQKIIDRMTPLLSAGQQGKALEQGLAGLEQALSGSAPTTPRKNELPNGIVEEKGI